VFNKDVALVVFMVSLGNYDWVRFLLVPSCVIRSPHRFVPGHQTLFEDATTNRLQEDLKCFEVVLKEELLKEAKILLVFNMSDVFKDKIEKKVQSSQKRNEQPQYKFSFAVRAFSLRFR